MSGSSQNRESPHYSQKSRCPQNAAAALFSFSVQPGVSSGLAGGDEAHLVDLVGVAATGQVVDGSVQALQDLSLIHISPSKSLSSTEMHSYFHGSYSSYRSLCRGVFIIIPNSCFAIYHHLRNSRFCDYIIWELSVIKHLRQILLLNCLSIPVYLY